MSRTDAHPGAAASVFGGDPDCVRGTWPAQMPSMADQDDPPGYKWFPPPVIRVWGIFGVILGDG